MTTRINLWSSGGGVQSTAIAVLILTGKLPKPDLAVIADTEREKQSTWDYLERWTGPALEAFGVPLHRVRKSDWCSYDLEISGSLAMPVFTRANGEVGKLPAYCSDHWKKRVVRRWADAQLTNAQFRVWMGISWDEPRRIRPTFGKWETWYPLFEQRIGRGECVRIVNAFGWPDPPSSSCWMCPNRTAQEWKELGRTETAKAAELEQVLQQIDPDVYLHQLGIPLLEAIDKTEIDTQIGLWDRCDSGQCFV